MGGWNAGRRSRGLLRLVVAGALVGGVVSLEAAAPASAAGRAGTVACVSKATGVTRVIAATRRCRASEWRVLGITGAAGPAGPAGPVGATGVAGPIGATGATGAAGATGPAGFSAALTCAAGGACAIGDVGPGSGIVFYDAGTVQSWGRYLEAAPETWNGGVSDPTVKWCQDAMTFLPNLATGATGSRSTSASVGAGWSNTMIMTGTTVGACTSGAANIIRAYHGGGKVDWFLPSLDELSALYAQRDLVGGFGGITDYWSSSEGPSANNYSLTKFFTDGTNLQASRNALRATRPIRAF